MNKKKMSISLNSLLLFSDIVIPGLFRENFIYFDKRGNISHDKKRDGKAKVANKLIKKRYQ